MKLTESQKILLNLKEVYDTRPSEKLILEDLTYLARLAGDNPEHLFVDKNNKYFLVRLHNIREGTLVRGNTYNIAARNRDNPDIVDESPDIVDTIYQARIIENEDPDTIAQRKSDKKEKDRLNRNERAKQKRLKQKEEKEQRDQESTNNTASINDLDLDSISDRVIKAAKEFNNIIEEAKDDYLYFGSDTDNEDAFYDDDFAYDKAKDAALDEFRWLKDIIPKFKDEDNLMSFVDDILGIENKNKIKEILTKYI